MRKIIPFVLLIASTPGISADEKGVDLEQSPVAFTVSFAKRLRGFHSFEDLQRAARAPGKITGDGGPGTTIHWISTSGDTSYMLAEKNEAGVIGVSILTEGDVSITINTAGAWACEPQDACN